MKKIHLFSFFFFAILIQLLPVDTVSAEGTWSCRWVKAEGSSCSDAYCTPYSECRGGTTCSQPTAQDLGSCTSSNQTYWDKCEGACALTGNGTDYCGSAGNSYCGTQSNPQLETYGWWCTCIMPTSTPWPTEPPRCGDFVCNGNETCTSCPDDCSSLPQCRPQDNDRPTPTPTRTPTPTVTRGATMTPQPTATQQPTATPRPRVNISYNIYLHGLGESGDNANPAHSLSNKNPRRKARSVSIEVLDAQNRRVASATSEMRYASESGSFKGTADLGFDITQGNYLVTLKSDQYLRNTFPGIQFLTPGETSVLPVVTLVSGDVVPDNQLSILDYNILYGCYTGNIIINARSCTSNQKNMADLTDEGTVNHYDYNLFLRELSVQFGR